MGSKDSATHSARPSELLRSRSFGRSQLRVGSCPCSSLRLMAKLIVSLRVAAVVAPAPTPKVKLCENDPMPFNTACGSGLTKLTLGVSPAESVTRRLRSTPAVQRWNQSYCRDFLR